jgi:hypothetical protein
MVAIVDREFYFSVIQLLCSMCTVQYCAHSCLDAVVQCMQYIAVAQ